MTMAGNWYVIGPPYLLCPNCSKKLRTHILDDEEPKYLCKHCNEFHDKTKKFEMVNKKKSGGRGVITTGGK